MKTVALYSLVIFILVGCATGPSSAPFGVYQSPLLSERASVQKAPNRTFSPFDDAVAPTTERMVATTDKSSVWESTPQTAPTAALGIERPLEPKRRLPSLSVGTGRAQTENVPGTVGPQSAEFVWAMLRLNGVPLPSTAPNQVVALYKTVKKRGKVDYTSKPIPGDVVFFHNTADTNSDRRNNDWYTLAGVVTDVSRDNTATIAMYDGKKVVDVFLNLERPNEATVSGKPVNSALRKPVSTDAPHTQYFAGQLFAGFGRVMDNRHDMLMVRNWQPGMSVSKP